MRKEKTIGWLLIAGAVGVLIPYSILTIIFDYPDILRQNTSIILTKFHEGGNELIWTWFFFALIGLPLIPAYILIGQKFENKAPLVRMATTIGVIGLIVQMIGLLRWTFVVPVLADSFVHATDEATKAAAIVSFKTIHQFGGVILYTTTNYYPEYAAFVGRLAALGADAIEIWNEMNLDREWKAGTISPTTARIANPQVHQALPADWQPPLQP